MSEGWMSIVEYARRFNVSDMTVRRRIKTGKLPAELKDGKYFIRINPQTAPKIVDEKQTERQPEFRPTQHAFEARPPLPRQEEPSPPREHVNNGAYRQHQPFYRRPQPHFPNHANSIVDATRLVEFCESMLDKLMEREELLKTRYQEEIKHLREKIEWLETSVKQREGENQRLHQEIEDLEILIKMLDGKAVQNQRREASP